MNVKLGFCSAILPDLTVEQVLEFAATNGFSCVELMCRPVGRAERRYAGVTPIGPVCIEVEDRAHEATLSMREAALRQSAAFLRQFVAH
jgi:hypothetical protein